MSNYFPLDTTFPWSKRSDGFLQYGEVFKDCIEAIIEKYAENRPFHDYALAPIIFLLRQYIELQLKGIIIMCKGSLPQPDKHHNIETLYNDALAAVDEKCGKENVGKANADAEKFIKDLGKFDSKGEAFRYPETKGGEEYCKKISQADGWLYERLTAFDEFADIAKKVIGDLEGIEAYLDIFDENEQEQFANSGP
jgi:hypothetical protein